MGMLRLVISLVWIALAIIFGPSLVPSMEIGVIITVAGIVIISREIRMILSLSFVLIIVVGIFMSSVEFIIFGLVGLIVVNSIFRSSKEQAKREAREKAVRKTREKAERKAKEEADRIAKDEADTIAKEDAKRRAKEEAEWKAREKAERKAREEAERKARDEADRIAKEEAKRKAKEEAERKAKEEAERKASEKAKRKAKEKAVGTIQKIIKRSSKLKVSVLAEMLEMEEKDMLMWLYDLPEEFGFNIADDIIEFDVDNIDTAIDNLLASYETMEKSKRGKQD
ncbi:MAG: hypothetical protein ACXAD7_08965 [Candidatus Kariarchaeaceae archaeon]|jgi:flagellar biosynthesis GTPase FlhF